MRLFTLKTTSLQSLGDDLSESDTHKTEEIRERIDPANHPKAGRSICATCLYVQHVHIDGARIEHILWFWITPRGEVKSEHFGLH